MDNYARGRRQTYDLDYFASGGLERRSGLWDRRLGKDRRKTSIERRLLFNLRLLEHIPEKRTGIDRRKGKDHRKSPAGHFIWL